MFLNCRMPEKSTRKARLEVCDESTQPVFEQEKNKPSNQKLHVHKCNTAFVKPLFLVYRILLQLNGLITWVWNYKQIYMHTNTHKLFENKI